MKYSANVLVTISLLFVGLTSAFADQQVQRVLYIGHRAYDFDPFLKEHFNQVESTSIENFQPAQAEEFDVVLLDWPQSTAASKSRNSGDTPLGKREEWGTPTVLLGSAGMNMAVGWELKGGSG